MPIMPAMNTQFSIGLELTRLVPLNLAASKAANLIMSLARDLQSSGSDIVIEEDLALMFGKSLIAPEIASSFRAVVVRTSSYSLTECISLNSGAGPTVNRALLAHDQPAYFATVVQCSFLASLHDRSALSTAIVHSMEKEREDAPSQHVSRAIPSQEGVFGFLRACEEQTTEFPWASLTEAVAKQLGIPDFAAVKGIPPAVLRGAMYLFPMVQRVKDDYEAVIQLQGSEGLCPLVVWAHRILGLDVLVRQPRDAYDPVRHIDETVFGRGTPKIIIEDQLDRDNALGATITLLIPATKEALFTFQPDPDEMSIDAYSKSPAKGYGKRQLEITWSHFVGSFGDQVEGKVAAIKELQLMVVGLALYIANNLYKSSHGPSPFLPSEIGITLSASEERCATESQRLLEAARLLFNDQTISGDAIKNLAALYAGSPIRDLKPPVVWKTVSEKYGYRLNWEETILQTVRNLALVLLALSHVVDLDPAAIAPLNNDISLVSGHNFSSQLHSWDGENALEIPDIAWFEVLAQLMIGHITEISGEHLDRTSLVSNRGWSLFTNTYGLADPSFMDPGYVYIRFGVPCRNGVFKHRILDAPLGPISALLDEDDADQRIFPPGNWISLTASNNPTFGSFYCGERGDTFVVSIRITMQGNELASVHRTGYRELFAGAWFVIRTQSCDHPSLRQHDKHMVPDGAMASKICDDRIALGMGNTKLIICLTAFNKVARWHALVTLAWYKIVRGMNQFRLLLRGKSTCFDCAVAQASLFAERCYVVL
ncbi:MAG: hypothetical protein Q9209_003613 [Squamulea sp. 1 TL-2023]